MLKVGKKAPQFKLQDQYGTWHTWRGAAGEWHIIYFYPKDDTPGCTKEACTIAEIYKDFKRAKVNVFGVSKDSVKSHLKFAEKYQLPFTLLSDPEMKMMAKYGATVEKKMFGRPVRGTKRITYLVNPEGVIVKVYPDVDPASHALELLADIKQFKKAERKMAKALATETLD